MQLDVMASRSTDMFLKCFGRKPRWNVAAPGRVNIIGEHTDYNDGFVLPMAIERHTLVTAANTTEREVTIYSETNGETATFSVREEVEPGEPGWSNYIRGVVAGFQRLGKPVPGFNMLIESNLPYGGGLASSAALEVAVATLLESICAVKLDPLKKALLCQEAEHEFAGVPCGIMDQFTSVMALQDKLLLLDCRSLEAKEVPLDDPRLTVLIINTNIRHKHAEGEYARRKAECEEAARELKVRALRDVSMPRLNADRKLLKPVVFARAKHVISENERTLAAAKAIQTGDWTALGSLMYESHASLRNDYEVSCPELDLVVNIAQRLGPARGVMGCRMTGGGFGGCAVALIKTEQLHSVTRRISEAYEERTHAEPMIFSSRPASGVRLLRGQ